MLQDKWMFLGLWACMGRWDLVHHPAFDTVVDGVQTANNERIDLYWIAKVDDLQCFRPWLLHLLRRLDGPITCSPVQESLRTYELIRKRW